MYNAQLHFLFMLLPHALFQGTEIWEVRELHPDHASSVWNQEMEVGRLGHYEI